MVVALQVFHHVTFYNELTICAKSDLITARYFVHFISSGFYAFLKDYT